MWKNWNLSSTCYKIKLYTTLENHLAKVLTSSYHMTQKFHVYVYTQNKWKHILHKNL